MDREGDGAVSLCAGQLVARGGRLHEGETLCIDVVRLVRQVRGLEHFAELACDPRDLEPRLRRTEGLPRECAAGLPRAEGVGESTHGRMARRTGAGAAR